MVDQMSEHLNSALTPPALLGALLYRLGKLYQNNAVAVQVRLMVVYKRIMRLKERLKMGMQAR